MARPPVAHSVAGLRSMCARGSKNVCEEHVYDRQQARLLHMALMAIWHRAILRATIGQGNISGSRITLCVCDGAHCCWHRLSQ